MFERSIAEKIKFRRERSDEIERKEENIDNELFKAYLLIIKVQVICGKS